MIIDLKGWAPDSPAFSDGDNDAKGVIPDMDGYRPLPSLQSTITGLSASAQGACAVTDTSSNVAIVAGDASKLYKNSSSTFSDVSKVGGYSTSSDARWEFALHRTKLIATNYADAVQYFDLASSSVFADLFGSANKPKAKTIAVANQFLMMGNTSDATDGTQPQRAWWTAYDDPTDATPAASTQCDFQDISGGGSISRIIGGEYFLIFMERQIVRAQYVGPPLIFDLSAVVDRQRGTIVPGSVAALGRLVFFLAEDGLYMQDGVSSTPVGNRKVDRYIWSQIQTNNIGRISSAIDPLNKLYVMAFPSTSATSGNYPDTLLFYHWPSGKFSYDTVDTELVYSALSLGRTLEQLDAISSSIDALPYSLDSVYWSGRRSTIAAFNRSHNSCEFSGSARAAQVDTREIQFFPGRRSRVLRARPIIDNANTTVAIGGRLRQGDTAAFNSAASQNTAGFCPADLSTFYHRFRIAVPAAETWTYLQGLDVPDNYIKSAGWK